MCYNNKRVAILIDGDNISSGDISKIYYFAHGHGNVSIRKVFGDWTRQNLNSWKRVSAEYGFHLVQATAYISGKNTSDLAIVMEAMDIMYRDLAETICIASSDGDFTSLVQRLRESGIQVLGYGCKQTHPSLVNSCDEFRFGEQGKDQLSDEYDIPKNSSEPNITTKRYVTPLERDRVLFVQAFKTAAGSSCKATLEEIKSPLMKYIKNFRSKDYGYNKVAKIYEALGFVVSKRKKVYIIEEPEHEITKTIVSYK